MRGLGTDHVSSATDPPPANSLNIFLFAKKILSKLSKQKKITKIVSLNGNIRMTPFDLHDLRKRVF